MHISVARSDKDKEAVFALRYRAYRDVEAIPSDKNECFSDEFDGLKNVFTFLLSDGETSVSSIRACFQRQGDASDTLPSFGIFRNEILSTVGEGYRILEANRFVSEPGNSSMSHAAVFLGVYAVAIQCNCTDLCAAVRPNQIPFYERFFGMRQISDARQYHGLSSDMVLMWANDENFRWNGIERLKEKGDILDEKSFFKLLQEVVPRL